NAGLVDRFRGVIFPVITGASGRHRIYDGYPDVALAMTSSRTVHRRIQLVEYVPTVLAGPPGAHDAHAGAARAGAPDAQPDSPDLAPGQAWGWGTGWATAASCSTPGSFPRAAGRGGTAWPSRVLRSC